MANKTADGFIVGRNQLIHGIVIAKVSVATKGSTTWRIIRDTGTGDATTSNIGKFTVDNIRKQSTIVVQISKVKKSKPDKIHLPPNMSSENQVSRIHYQDNKQDLEVKQLVKSQVLKFRGNLPSVIAVVDKTIKRAKENFIPLAIFIVNDGNDEDGDESK